MKTIIKDKDKPIDWNFPTLGIDSRTSLVVLFSKEDCGTVIVSGDEGTYKVGQFETDWDMDYFIPFNKEIVLSND